MFESLDAEHRLNWLLDELANRFPDSVSLFSSVPPEIEFLAAIDTLLSTKRCECE